MPSTLRFELTTPVLDDRPVYLSGNFCDWYPDVEAFRLWPVTADHPVRNQPGPELSSLGQSSLEPSSSEPSSLGHYALDFPADVALPDVLDYKYTRGGWDHVELDEAGEVPPNRISQQETGIRRDRVPHWRWFGRSFNPDLLPKLDLMVADFPRPQRQTERRVRVLLPHDYEYSDKRYPVLYLSDGQNLIGAGSGYGSWEIDRRLAVLASRYHHELIVVAIDHGEDSRLQEFTLDRTLAGTGDGRNYLDFVVHTLKPQIDQTFRTKTDAVHTGIGGSSLGGLISLYGGLLHPRTFGRWLVFSPSLWIAKTVFADAARCRVEPDTKVYVFGGGDESKSMVSSLTKLIDSLTQSPDTNNITSTLAVDPNGRHSESFWGHEFPKAVEWLFY